MGNESGKLKDLEIDKIPVECTPFWSLYNALASTNVNDNEKQFVSIFQSMPQSSEKKWALHDIQPLFRATKNLMIYRHPYILKYISTWESGGRKYLATERVQPLQTVLSFQNDIQICLGLRTILCSLIFLIEKAMASHLNICIQSIYVNDSGSWRLSGFEYVWKIDEVNKELLSKLDSFRSKNFIDPCLKTFKKDEKIVGIEQYAFATICEQLLSTERNNQSTAQIIPYIDDFRVYCQTHLKHPKCELRPQLSAVLLHPYFNHEFVLIHAFLFELPLKNTNERQEFFTGLIDRLRYFDENVVAIQFAGDLLSRMVLLDPTAQLCVTPYILRTRNDHSPALFTATTYSKYILPHVLKMFRLRDAQIRLILLEYFTEFIHLLSRDQLELQILPHLLAGMYDTNDFLVAKTLRSLADLIPFLGSTCVLGNQQRRRLFSDGRPHAAITNTIKHWIEPRSITPVLGESGDCQMVSGSPLPLMTITNIPSAHTLVTSSKSNSVISLNKYENHNIIEENSVYHTMMMQHRLSPDGGEDITLNNPNIKLENTNNGATNDIHSIEKLEIRKDMTSNDISDNNWLDWESTKEEIFYNNIKEIENQSLAQTPSAKYENQKVKIEDDLNKLDIQIKNNSAIGDRRNIADVEKVDKTVVVDYFKDMEPNIVMKAI